MNASNTGVAVIIANRNNGRFLPQCLESVLGQALQPAEIMVVDDCSTDDSRDVISKYVRTGKVRAIFNDKQIGVAASRAMGISNTASPLLTTLDADDYYYSKEKLAREVAVLTGPGERRIAFSDVMRVRVTGELIGRVSEWRRIREGDLWFHIRHLHGFIPRDYLVRRVDYEAAGGFDPSLAIYEDWDLKVRLSPRCTWHYSGAIGTAYRDNPTGLSRSPRKQHIAAMRRVFWSSCPAKTPLTRAAAFARFFLYHSLYLGRPAL